MDLKATLADVGEHELIDYLRSRIPAGNGVVVGVGDDAAAVEMTGLTLVTADSLVESVHFSREWAPPRLVGRKALSVNLSDIGAMAGVAQHAVVSLCLPRDLPVAFVDSLYDGLLERAAEANVNIIGGNIAATPGPVVIDVTMLGHATKLLRRSGAVAGDLVVVSGTLGGAAAGLGLLKQGARLSEDGDLVATGIWTDNSRDAVLACLRAQLDPTPPVALGRALVEEDLARAAIDVSDGLAADLRHLCVESGVGARIVAAKLPVNPAAEALARAQGEGALAHALFGGEDYQLLVAVPRERFAELSELGGVWNIPITAIGEFTSEAELVIEENGQTRPLGATGFDHFRPQAR
jgi:thiamine-monophosphate kinase